MPLNQGNFGTSFAVVWMAQLLFLRINWSTVYEGLTKPRKGEWPKGAFRSGVPGWRPDTPRSSPLRPQSIVGTGFSVLKVKNQRSVVFLNQGVLEDGLTTGSHLAMATVAACLVAGKSKMATDPGGSRQQTLDRSPGEWNKAWVAGAGRPMIFHLHCAVRTTDGAGKTLGVI